MIDGTLIDHFSVLNVYLGIDGCPGSMDLSKS